MTCRLIEMRLIKEIMIENPENKAVINYKIQAKYKQKTNKESKCKIK